MAEETRITGIYEIKIEQGPALRAFEEVKKRLDDTRAKIKDLNKENRDLIKAEQEVTAAIKSNGTATTAQAKQLETIKRLRADTNKQVSEAVITEKALSAQTRELSNDLSGLTENSLRFRDKMALATTEALRQSGIIEQLSNREQELNKSLTTVTHTLESNETKLSELNIAYSKGEKSAEQYAAEQAALNKEIEAGKAANTVLAAELQQVSGKTDVLERQIHELNMELNAGKISAEQYRVGLSKIEEETRKAGMATSTLTDRFDSFVGSQGKELKSTLSSLALNYVGVGAAIYGVQNIIGGAIDTVVEFDKRLSSIRALGPEYASRIEDIGEAAKTAGINFGFTAAESLDAVEALAKAGVSVSDILGGALPGALTLAAAGEVSVAEAAETASKAMTQFGLAGEDIPKLADLLAAAAATATGDVGDFNQALNQAGLVASQLNIPIEEAIGTLTAFASAGLLGSDAGTSFRTMLLRLQNPTEESAALLKKYNIDAFDLQGNFVGIEALAGQLQDRLGGLTQEQRSAALAQIFGSDAIRAANVLYTQGAEGVAKYTDQVNQTGFAATVAAEKTNNLEGDVDKLGAQYDALVFSVEDGDGAISNAFRGFIQGITEALGLLQEFNKLTGDRRSFQQDAEVFLDQINKSRDGLSQITLDSTAGTEFVERYRQVITSIKETENAEERLVRAIDNRKQALDRVKQLQDQIAANPADDTRLQLELAAAKAAVVQTQEIIDATRKDTAAKQEATAATEVATEATVADTQAKSDSAKEVANVAGSLADLTAKINELQTKQSQSTDSAQFAAYQSQINELEASIERIKNTSATPLIDAAFGTNLEALPPATVDPGTPLIDELEAQKLADLEDMRAESRVNEIQGIRDFNLERAILEEEFAQGLIESRAELNAQLAQLDQQRFEQDIQLAQGTLNSISNLADGILAIEQGITNARTSELQKRIDADKKAGIDTTELERQQNELLAEQERKAFNTKRAVALAQLAIDQAKAISSLTAAAAANPANAVTAGAAGAAQFAAGIIQIGANIAQAVALLSQKAPGFAAGGQISPSGVVTSGWGPAVNRPNGDNVLVRAGRQFVTLKTGELVLNDKQQLEARRQAGDDIFGRIGVPGFTSFGGKTMARHYLDMGYAEGGVIGLVTPRPTPGAMVQSQMVSQLQAFADRPLYASIQEIERVRNDVRIAEYNGEL